MPIDGLHEKVAAVALRAAAGHGFALGGGNALIAHGVIERPTEDVDLFSNQERGVAAAAGAVEAALTEAGFAAERQDKTAGLSDIFYDMSEGLAEWIITAPGGRQMALQMAYFDRAQRPVAMEFGPVLDLEDVAGGKVCALASRAYERDFVDTAALLQRYTPEELISFATRLDPGLEGQDFAEAAQRLDQLPDRAFTPLGLSPEDVTELRGQFAVWPRQAQARREERAADVSGSTGGQVRDAHRTDLGADHDFAEPDYSAASRPPHGADTAAAWEDRADVGLEDPDPEAEI